MYRCMCKGKIHRMTVTGANLDYVGSVTIDAGVMEQARILPFEIVQITNLRNAALWQTYAIPAASGSGTLCLNGPPAHLFQPGDPVIILSMGYFEDFEIARLTPRVVMMGEGNRVVKIVEHEVPTLRN
jgi:aspartate 1-decarboxylase